MSKWNQMLRTKDSRGKRLGLESRDPNVECKKPAPQSQSQFNASGHELDLVETCFIGKAQFVNYPFHE